MIDNKDKHGDPESEDQSMERLLSKELKKSGDVCVLKKTRASKQT